MMTYQELLDEVLHLSREERLSLITALLRSLHEETTPTLQETDALRVWAWLSTPSDRPLLSMRGILQPDGDSPPSDEALADDYIQYLIEKYT